jgi:hypothetical protein
MNRPEHDNVSFFVGTEVEHTAAFGKKTLFVIGLQPVTEIALNLSRSMGIEHIYFGANMSFPKLEINDVDSWSAWEQMIVPFLEDGMLCTLDIDISCVEGLVEGRLCEYSNFIPMISAKLPYIRQLNYNATLKLDDKDFKASNPGVWCHSIHKLMDRDQFTDWSKYTKDEVL